MSTGVDHLRLSVAAHRETLRAALEFRGHITGSTHGFYHYPARFAPELVRALIESFSAPGDWALDCFMGGGTSIVEGLAIGRRMLGVDLNSLSLFVTEAKTSPLSEEDEGEVLEWADAVRDCFMYNKVDWVDVQGVKNLPAPVEGFTAEALLMTAELSTPLRQAFARTVLLRLGQWALDGREFSVPSRRMLAARLPELAHSMVEGMREFRQRSEEWTAMQGALEDRKRLINRSIVGLGEDLSVQDLKGKVRLVVTSPPYPGVHVLYHRWQFRGRRETSAPYWVADVQDGHGESYYTLGGRSASGIERYYTTLCAGFTSIRPLLHTDAVIAQVVAFKNADEHLPRFNRAMAMAGYEELVEGDDRLWRGVPNRRWYNRVKSEGTSTGAGREVLLLHRMIPSPA